MFIQDEITLFTTDQDTAESSSLHVLKELEVGRLGFAPVRTAGCPGTCPRGTGPVNAALGNGWRGMGRKGLLSDLVFQSLGTRLWHRELGIPFTGPFPKSDGASHSPSWDVSSVHTGVVGERRGLS